MKIYQTLKPSSFAFMATLGIGAMLLVTAIAGDFSVITPQLVILIIELAFIMYGLIFGKNHLNYCASETHGYKYFRSIPNFESHFRKQCIASDIVCYGIGYAVTILNFIFMPYMAFIGIIYLFIISLSTIISAFVDAHHRLYIYTMMFSMIPLITGVMIFAIVDDIPKNLIPYNVQLIIWGCVTVFAAVALILFYKRLAKNLRTSYGKG